MKAAPLQHPTKFQSRYRAASHFRFRQRYQRRTSGFCFNLVIERLLISGFKEHETEMMSGVSFNLVIERLLISGPCPVQRDGQSHQVCFNLVIERLLISGSVNSRWQSLVYLCFNLVIERLLISGYPILCLRGCHHIACFNLVIERLLISGPSPRSS